MPVTTILLVEGEPATRRAIRALLEAPAWRVLEAGGVSEAEAYLRSTAVELMFLDLPTLGDGALTRLQQLMGASGGRTLPDVIVMVESSGLADAAEALRRGASDYLEKPIVRPEVVQMAIEKGLARHLRVRELLTLRQALERHACSAPVPLPQPHQDAVAEGARPAPVFESLLTHRSLKRSPLSPQGFELLELRSLTRLPLVEARAVFESAYLQLVLDSVDGNVRSAAERAGIARQHLYRRINDYGLRVSGNRSGASSGEQA